MKNKPLLSISFLLGGAILLILAGIRYGIVYDVQKAYRQDGLIRLHVIPNSNSSEDQMIKLEVRDEILRNVEPLVYGVTDAMKAYEIIENNLSLITQVATRQVQDHNKHYGATATMGTYRFPRKTYGSITLPAGDYQALRVTLGNGYGNNWWCVLFPPLCLVDLAGSYERVDSVVCSDNSPVEVRFKAVELWNRLTSNLVTLAK